MTLRLSALPLALLLLVALSTAWADTRTLRTEYQAIKLERIAGDLEHPWSLDFLPDGRLIVTERPGQLSIVDSDGSTTQVSGTPSVSAINQGGLLEVLLHPEFADNGLIYLTYSKDNGSGETATALARARLADNRLHDLEDIYVQER